MKTDCEKRIQKLEENWNVFTSIVWIILAVALIYLIVYVAYQTGWHTAIDSCPKPTELVWDWVS